MRSGRTSTSREASMMAGAAQGGGGLMERRSKERHQQRRQRRTSAAPPPRQKSRARDTHSDRWPSELHAAGRARARAPLSRGRRTVRAGVAGARALAMPPCLPTCSTHAHFHRSLLSKPLLHSVCCFRLNIACSLASLCLQSPSVRPSSSRARPTLLRSCARIASVRACGRHCSNSHLLAPGARRAP